MAKDETENRTNNQNTTSRRAGQNASGNYEDPEGEAEARAREAASESNLD